VGLLDFIGLEARRPTQAWVDRLGSGLQYFGQSCWLMVVPVLAGAICAHGIVPLGEGIPGFARAMQSRSKQTCREQDYRR
jgi:ABC-type dipeptide/oligopeptide/nickel transport system permease subunit